jgi:hypothetical protein
MLVMPWGRVGSNLIFDIVSQSGRLKLDNEKLTQIKSRDEQIAWFHDFYEIGNETPSRPHIGSKQSIHSIRDLGEFHRLFLANNVRIIRIKRDNPVKTAVSQMRAEEYARKTLQETGVARWGVLRGKEPLGAIDIDPEKLLSRVRIVEAEQKRLLDGFSGTEILDIEYEEIRSSLDDVVRRVRDFLGLSHRPFTLKFDKATPDNLESAISNFAEVRHSLSANGYGNHLQ